MNKVNTTSYPTQFSITLNDALVEEPDLLDNMDFGNAEQTAKFKEAFIARWGIYELGAQTITLWKRWVHDRFTLRVPYYKEIIDWYNTQIDMIENKINDETQYIDLPNKTSTGEYVSSKEKYSRVYIDNPIERKKEYRKLIQNVYEEFVEDFKDLMCLVYY